MPNATFADRIRKKLGIKTSEDKVNAGLRATRDILEKMGEHDIAINVEDMLFNGSMAGKCIMLVSLNQILPLMMTVKGMIDIYDAIENLEEMLREIRKKK
jgi:hypothetical protein